MVRDTVAHLRRRGPPGLPRLRALLRRLPLRPRRTPRPWSRAALEAGAERRRHVRHQRRHAPVDDHRGGQRRSTAPAPGVERRTGSASTARTTPPARWPTPSPPSRRASRTSSAPPTATASGPATPTCSPSSATCNSSSGCPSYRTAAWNRWCASRTRIAEIANIAPDTHQAYVGAAAFAHKAGLHASAIKVDPVLYNHVDPSVVGNDMRILVTEMAGRASIELKSRELGLDLAGHPDDAVPGHPAGQGAGGGRLVVRGRRRVVRAAGPRRAAGEARPAVRAGVLPGAWSSTARTARWSPRRRSRSGYAASG